MQSKATSFGARQSSDKDGLRVAQPVLCLLTTERAAASAKAHVCRTRSTCHTYGDILVSSMWSGADASKRLDACHQAEALWRNFGTAGPATPRLEGAAPRH